MRRLNWLRSRVVIAWSFGYFAAMTAHVWLDLSWWAASLLVLAFGLVGGAVAGFWGIDD